MGGGSAGGHTPRRDGHRRARSRLARASILFLARVGRIRAPHLHLRLLLDLRLTMGKAAEELPFVDGTHPVYRAANNGDTGAVKRALDTLPNKKERWVAVNSRNEDADDQSPLHVAASRGYMLMATHLLDAGAELLPDDKGRTPLHVAAANDDKDMVALLLKRAKNKFQAKTTFTTSGYSRPAAPVHLCKKPDIRKMLWFRGCGDEDGGKTRVLLEGDGRNVTLPKGAMVLIAVATVVTGLYVRARVQIAQGYARPKMRKYRS